MNISDNMLNQTELGSNRTDSVRMGKDLQSPLVNLILAASLLSKFTTGKPKSQSRAPPQYHPVVYGQPFYWYPPHLNALTTNQVDSPLKQQVIHFHQVPLIASIPGSTKNEENATTPSSNIGNDAKDRFSAITTNITDELKTLIKDLLKKNALTSIGTDQRPFANTTDPYIEMVTESTIYEDTEEQDEVLEEPQRILEEVETVTKRFFSNEDLETAAAHYKRRTEPPGDFEYGSALDPAPQEADEDEEEDDLDDMLGITSSLNKQRQRFRVREKNTPQRRIQQRERPQPSLLRINSKKPVPRRTTPIALIYDEVYPDQDEVATTVRRRKVPTTTKRNVLKRTTTTEEPNYDFDDVYEAPKRKSASKRRRHPARMPTTTETVLDEEYAYDKYDENRYDSQYEGESSYDEEEPNQRQPSKGNRRPAGGQERQRQKTTTEATTEYTTLDTTLEPTTLKPTTTTAEVSTASSEGYPYAGQDNSHVSFTYGPPGQYPMRPGYGYGNYGPSQGNEQVSFTYAPSAGAPSGASLMNNWYNNYAKPAMFQRISDLLLPNNFYSQYDSNYNDDPSF